MTKDEIMKLKGQELHRAVAVAFTFNFQTSFGEARFDTDMNDAMLVVEKMRERLAETYYLDLEQPKNGKWYCFLELVKQLMG